MAAGKEKKKSELAGALRACPTILCVVDDGGTVTGQFSYKFHNFKYNNII
jgi:hypothetical protein